MARFRLSRTISRYVSLEYLFSFLVAFLFFFIVFFINQILLLAEDILSKEVAFRYVVLLIFYSLPSIIAITFPFATLVGALMAIGRFSADNEMLAMKASGIPDRRVFLPILVFSIVFALISFFMNDYFLPAGTVKFGNLYRKIIYANPALELDSYSIKRYQDSFIVTGEVKGKTINNIIIFDKADRNDRRILSASSAQLTENIGSRGVISLSLNDVFLHTVKDKKIGDFEYSFSKNLVYNILLKDLSISIQSLTPREMSSMDIYSEIRKKDKELSDQKQNLVSESRKKLFELANYYRHEIMQKTEVPLPESLERMNRILNDIHSLKNRDVQDRNLQFYWLELHKKFSIPFGCISFIFLAFPLGLLAKRAEGLSALELDLLFL